jgi:hypothetical protein
MLKYITYGRRCTCHGAGYLQKWHDVRSGLNPVIRKAFDCCATGYDIHTLELVEYRREIAYQRRLVFGDGLRPADGLAT